MDMFFGVSFKVLFRTSDFDILFLQKDFCAM